MPVVNKPSSSIFKDIKCNIPGSSQIIQLDPVVLNVFWKHRQIDNIALEAGGQLFAETNNEGINITFASEPSKVDVRSRNRFEPCRKAENKAIRQMFKKSLHFVGDWHTHPQQIPKPSSKDLQSIKECFRLSDHELNFFIMIVIGTADFPQGIWVSLHNHTGYNRLAHMTIEEE